MGLVASWPQQGYQPSRFPKLARRGAVALPWGGPTGVGGSYGLASALTLVGGAAQPEIWTLTLGGSGNVTMIYQASDIFTSATFNTGTVTAASLLAALQTNPNNPMQVAGIWPSWVLPAGSITGSTGGPFTITFGGSSGYNGAGTYSRIGGNVLFTTTGTATATLVRSQRGSVGAGQYEYADGVTYTTCSAFLVDTIPSGPTGTIATIPYGANTDQTDTLWAWVEGMFFANQQVSGVTTVISPNLTDAIVAASPRLSYYLGTTIETPGAELRLLQ
jgi:hypothetical protein